MEVEEQGTSPTAMAVAPTKGQILACMAALARQPMLVEWLVEKLLLHLQAVCTGKSQTHSMCSAFSHVTEAVKVQPWYGNPEVSGSSPSSVWLRKEPVAQRFKLCVLCLLSGD